MDLVFKDYWGYGYDTVVTVARMLKRYIESNSTVPKDLENFQYTDKEVYNQMYNILKDRSFRFSGITVRVPGFMTLELHCTSHCREISGLMTENAMLPTLTGA